MRLVIACFVLIALCLPCSVGAVGKSTVDPNARAAGQMVSDVGTSRRVSYEAKRKTVVSILSDLSAMTGVVLKAGYNNEDWQVRDRRMNIFAKGVPLSSLMDSIARVMKFQWSKSEYEGVASYRLYMDRKVLLGAESKRLAEEERVRKRQLDGRQRMLSAMEADSGELVTQSAHVQEKSGGPMRLLPRILAEQPLAKQAFLSGEEFTLDISALSAEVRQALVGEIGTSDSTGGTIGISPLSAPSCTNMSLYRAGAAEPLVLPYVETGMGAMRFELKNKNGSCMGARKFADPESDLTKLEAKYMDAVLHNGDYQKLASEITEAGKALVIDMGDPLVEHSDDADLSAKVKMKVEGNEFANVLAALAESSSFSVVSDSFNKSFWDLAFREDEIATRAALDRIESVCRYNWVRHGSTLELNARDWYRKRAAQVPEAWLEAWRKAFKEHGTLDLDQLAQMATLTPERAGANIYGDEVLRQAYLGQWDSREFLRLYAVLDRSQRASILSEQGLALDSLAGNGAPAVQALLQRCSSVKGATEGGLSLVGKRVKDGGSIRYELSVTTPSGDNSGVGWTVRCPKYTPPVEEKL